MEPAKTIGHAKAGRDPAWGRITEEALQALLDRVGKPRRNQNSLFFNEWAFQDGRLSITRELALRYAIGVADVNSLFTDADYAQASIWQRLLAPPVMLSWLEQVNGASEGFPGCHTIWRGCELEWERPLFVGDELDATTSLTGARIVESAFSKTAAVQNYETVVQAAGGERVGCLRTSWHRFGRGEAKTSGKHVDRERQKWSEEALEGIWDEYRTQNTRRRGREPLFWEDVQEGVDIPYIIKGPTTLTSKLAFESVAFPGAWIVGHELALALLERHPRLTIRNEENVPEPPVAIHWTNERCQEYLGMPAAYEAGYERLSWLAQLLMSWSGDHGMLRALDVRFRGFHWQGDVVRLYGRVEAKEVSEDRHLVRLSLLTKTHRDEATSTGEATVELPSRSGPSVWPRSKGAR